MNACLLKLVMALFYCVCAPWLHASAEQNQKDLPLQTSNAELLSTPGIKPSQTVLISDPSKNSYYSQHVRFSARVASTHVPAVIPTGSVRFQLDGKPLAETSLVNGIASFTISSIEASGFEKHYIKAIYSGDKIYTASSDVLELYVLPVNTKTTLMSKVNPVFSGEPFNLIASIHSVAPGTAIPQGIVQFLVDGTVEGTANLDDKGRASFSIVENQIGNHSVKAIFLGNKNFNESSTRLTQQVDPIPTEMVLSSSQNPIEYSQPLKITVKINSSASNRVPTGVVQLKIDGKNFGTPSVLTDNQEITATLPNLKVGRHTIEAYYAGDDIFISSYAYSIQHVNKGNTKISLTSSENPSSEGSSIVFTATVSSDGGKPSGTVNFEIDGTLVSTQNLNSSNGQAVFSKSNLSSGKHRIIATFIKNANFNDSSTKLIQEVMKKKESQ